MENSLKQVSEIENTDHFVTQDGKCYAGTHLLIDLWGIQNTTNIDLIKEAILEAIEVSGATLLHIHLHHFTPNNGVSGVAILAESHISVHTWPERSFAAFDIFMCGTTQPEKCIPVLEKFFQPEIINVTTNLRGVTE